MSMVKITRPNGAVVYVGHWTDATSYHETSFVEAATVYRGRNQDAAIRIAEMLRAKGVNALAVAKDGRTPIEMVASPSQSAPAQDSRPSSFRGVTPKRMLDGSYKHEWLDRFGQSRSLSGSTPQECLEKLFVSYQFCEWVRDYTDSLPPEETESLPVPAVVEQPATTPGRVLRPGSSSADAQVEQRIPVPAFRVREDVFSEYQRFTKASSAADLRRRCIAEPAYKVWLDSQK